MYRAYYKGNPKYTLFYLITYIYHIDSSNNFKGLRVAFMVREVDGGSVCLTGVVFVLVDFTS